MTKIIMAVNHKNRKLGCAYYNVETSKLYLMEDMDESPPYDLLNLCNIHYNYYLFIIYNSKIIDLFIFIYSALSNFTLCNYSKFSCR